MATFHHARTIYGTYTRTSKTRYYRFIVVRSDGWHRFSETQQAAEKELQYQQRKGREVVMQEVTSWPVA